MMQFIVVVMPLMIMPESNFLTYIILDLYIIKQQ